MRSYGCERERGTDQENVWCLGMIVCVVISHVSLSLSLSLCLGLSLSLSLSLGLSLSLSLTHTHTCAYTHALSQGPP